MTDELDGTLADVYDWLVPDALLAPEESVAALAEVVDGLRSGARVLDCARALDSLPSGSPCAALRWWRRTPPAR